MSHRLPHHHVTRTTLRLLVLVMGLFAVGWLVYRYRVDVWRAISAMGAGIIWLAAVYALHLAIAAIGWRALVRSARWWHCFIGVWIGTSVNTLIPTATVGGEVVKARVLTRFKAETPTAIASVLADTAAQGYSLVLWMAVGLLALLALDADAQLVTVITVFCGLYLAGIGTFTWLQMRGPAGLLGRALERVMQQRTFVALASAQSIDAVLATLHATPWPMLRATLWRTLARIALTLEVWLAAALMGLPIGLLEALVLKSVTGAARGAAFFVPNGVGVQELAFVVTANALNIDPGLAVAVSIAIRIRELVVSAPALLVWYRIERR
jgi:glycosyltransferase 2 family protein